MKYLEKIAKHLDWFLPRAAARGYGPDDNAMWVSSLSHKTGRHPDPGTRPPGIESRCYRSIESPWGSNCYWDQPMVSFVEAFGEVRARAEMLEAARGYVADFLERSIAPTGLFYWGNHYYYDIRRGRIVSFAGSSDDPAPVDTTLDRCGYHETRPLPVAWEVFWDVDPQKTARAISQQGALHVCEPDTGCFDRHAFGQKGHAFLESGGILAQSLGWLYHRERNIAVLETARKVASFSFRHRNPATGLLINQPTYDRWDASLSTSEVGMWANCLFQAHESTGSSDFLQMGKEALEAWLNYAWDETEQRFVGKINVADGSPVWEGQGTEYAPGRHCEIWRPLFPTHDYPMQCAEACVLYFRATDNPVFEEGIRRWLRCLKNGLPARQGPNQGQGAYAEHYGRAIHFCLRAAAATGDVEAANLAKRIAEEAVGVLWNDGKFRTHPGEDRCDAVDGLGFLFHALFELEAGQPLDARGLTF